MRFEKHCLVYVENDTLNKLIGQIFLKFWPTLEARSKNFIRVVALARRPSVNNLRMDGE